jgi:hypothetical protein
VGELVIVSVKASSALYGSPWKDAAALSWVVVPAVIMIYGLMVRDWEKEVNHRDHAA